MSSHNLSDILITFKSASHVPVGDAIAQSSDPYVLACLTPRVPPSPEHPPFPLTYRSRTKRRTRDPEWNETWHLGGIPAEGFDLKIKLYDEDKPGDWDDKLGVAEYSVRKLLPAASDGKPGEEEEHELKIQKKKASKRVYALTYLVAWCHSDFKKQRGRVFSLIEVTDVDHYFHSESRKVDLYKELSMCIRANEMEYTHLSNDCTFLLVLDLQQGRIAGTQAHPTDPLIPSEGQSKVGDALLKMDPIAKRNKEKKERSQKNQSYVFEANKIQLLGTIPKDLRNEFVEFRPFIGWVFNVKGIRGYIFNRALHAQHRRVYCYDPSTKTGLVATPPEIDEIEAGDHVRGEKQKLDDSDEFAASRQFLEMVHWDEKPHPKVPGGRLYTYVITLQGEWRFTETGPEFTIDFLSKHSMHSDVSKEIACAGEFFIRRRRGRGHRKSNSNGSGSASGSGKMRKGSQDESKGKEDGEKKEEEFEEAGFGTEKDDNGDKDNEKSSEKTKTDDQESKEESSKENSNDANASEMDISNKAAHAVGKSRDPSNFVLIIDNDSGTYRPDSKSLPSLQKYLERNLPGLKVKAMACDDEKLKKWKEEQKPKKEVLKARKIAQVSSSSESSSDDEAVQLDE